MRPMSANREPKAKAMKIKQTLQNPFVLVAQGFVVGAALFFTTAPREAEPQPQGASLTTAALPDEIGA